MVHREIKQLLLSGQVRVRIQVGSEWDSRAGSLNLGIVVREDALGTQVGEDKVKEVRLSSMSWNQNRFYRGLIRTALGMSKQEIAKGLSWLLNGLQTSEQRLWKGFQVEAQGRYFVIVGHPKSTAESLQARVMEMGWRRKEWLQYTSHIIELKCVFDYWNIFISCYVVNCVGFGAHTHTHTQYPV